MTFKRPILISLMMVCLVLLSGYAFTDDRSNAIAVADSLKDSMNKTLTDIPVFDSSTTLEDYLAVAMERNPKLRASYYGWMAELKKSDYAGSLPDPMFNYAYFVENVETRVGPQEQRFGLRQSFPWFGTLGAKKDMVFAKSQVSYQRFQAAKFQLFYDVKAAFYEYYYLGQDIQITRDNLELLKFWESVAQSKYKVGLSKHPDVIKAQVELGKLEDHLQSLQEEIGPTVSRLRFLLNLPESVEIPIPGSISVDERSLNDDSVMAAIIQQNPKLKALENMIANKEAGIKLAGRKALPSFTVGVDYIQTGEALNPDLADSGKDPWMVGIGLSLPIWFGKNSARKSEADANFLSAKYNRIDSENELTAYTAKVLFEYSDALRKTQLYRDGLVPKAEQSLNTTYASYQAGETDFLNVLDAQRQLLNFQLTVAREQTRLATKRAQLEMLSGTELNDFIENNTLK